MTSNPFANAALALLYIVFIVLVINVGSHWAQGGKDNILMPMGMISLFVLSAATTGYVVLYQPIILFLDGKRKEGIRLFWRTIAVFAGMTCIVLLGALIVSKYGLY